MALPVQYGRIVNIDLKLPPRPPGFAFIQFEDGRDAEEVSVTHMRVCWRWSGQV